MTRPMHQTIFPDYYRPTRAQTDALEGLRMGLTALKPDAVCEALIHLLPDIIPGKALECLGDKLAYHGHMKSRVEDRT